MEGASIWLRGAGRARGDKLALFDKARRPTKNLQRLLPNVIVNENGRYRPNPKLMEEASNSFAPE